MKQIGQILRQRREAKKLSLDTVTLKTHITVRYLTALEEGNMSVFPAEVYFLGSLRRYALFLGLDPEQLVEIYRAQQKEAEKTEIQPVAQRQQKQRPFVPVVALAALAAVIILGLLAVVLWQKQEQAIPQPPPAVVEMPMISTQTPVVVVPKPESLTLTVTAHRPSWVRVTADGALAFEGTLVESQERSWTAKERFHFVVGYAPGVDVRLNGKPVDVRAGAVKDVNELDLTWKDAPRDAGAPHAPSPAPRAVPKQDKAIPPDTAAPSGAPKESSGAKEPAGMRPAGQRTAASGYRVHTDTKPASPAAEKTGQTAENQPAQATPQ